MPDDVPWTTEEEHAHVCGKCLGVWMHEDEDCPGPRYRHGDTIAYAPTFDCPTCVEEES